MTAAPATGATRTAEAIKDLTWELHVLSTLTAVSEQFQEEWILAEFGKAAEGVRAAYKVLDQAIDDELGKQAAARTRDGSKGETA